MSAYIDPRVKPWIRKPRKSDKDERLSGESAGRHPPEDARGTLADQGNSDTPKGGTGLTDLLRPSVSATDRLPGQPGGHFCSLMSPRMTICPFFCSNRLMICELAASSPEGSNFTVV